MTYGGSTFYAQQLPQKYYRTRSFHLSQIQRPFLSCGSALPYSFSSLIMMTPHLFLSRYYTSETVFQHMWSSYFGILAFSLLIMSFTCCSYCGFTLHWLCSCIDFIIVFRPAVPQTYFRYLGEHHGTAGDCVIMCFNSSLLMM
jgi:hypothetical protein